MNDVVFSWSVTDYWMCPNIWAPEIYKHRRLYHSKIAAISTSKWFSNKRRLCVPTFQHLKSPEHIARPRTFGAARIFEAHRWGGPRVRWRSSERGPRRRAIVSAARRVRNESAASRRGGSSRGIQKQGLTDPSGMRNLRVPQTQRTPAKPRRTPAQLASTSPGVVVGVVTHRSHLGDREVVTLRSGRRLRAEAQGNRRPHFPADPQIDPSLRSSASSLRRIWGGAGALQGALGHCSPVRCWSACSASPTQRFSSYTRCRAVARRGLGVWAASLPDWYIPQARSCSASVGHRWGASWIFALIWLTFAI